MNKIVPDDWMIRELHEICNGISVGHVGSTAEHYTDASGIKFIRTGDLKNGKITFSDTKYITKEFHQQLFKSKLSAGDILVSRVGDTGQAALVPEGVGEANCANIIIIKPSQEVCPDFLLLTINSADFFSQTASVSIGSAQSVLNVGIIKKLKTRIPPLPEQKKIAEILSGVDENIEASKSLLCKIENALQGLRDQTQFGEGKQVSIGDLVSRITTGTSVSGENRPCNASEYGVLKVSCVSKGEFLPKENKVIVGENKERATMPVRQGMLLMSRANTPELVGACGITNCDYNNLFLPDKVWNLELADTAQCSKEWLNNALNSQVGRSKLRDASTGTSDSMRNISQRNFFDTEILVPPIAIQNRQNNLIESLCAKKMMTAINLEKYLMLKTALSSDLLSGRKRVSI